MNTLRDKLGMSKGKADDLARQHGDQIERGMDKGARTLDSKTGGKHGDQIDSGTEKARNSLHDRENKDGGTA
ncbi:antitoxin [Streptomyces sp. NBC_01476]|uniref:antitoxin n=1 Tax=Streptomyces sp. NBC_01476 TaxID=2903881 RepID=UPI002E356CC5|nr:antitoxin [Streptomyces sp. NBC_01476]